MAANPQSPRATRSIDADDITESLPQTRSAVARSGERVIVEEDGVAVAAIVSLDDLKHLAEPDAAEPAMEAVAAWRRTSSDDL